MLNVRVTDEEGEMLKALAEAQGLSASDVVRQMIRRAYADTGRGHPKRARLGRGEGT